MLVTSAPLTESTSIVSEPVASSAPVTSTAPTTSLVDPATAAYDSSDDDDDIDRFTTSSYSTQLFPGNGFLFFVELIFFLYEKDLNLDTMMLTRP